MEGLDFENILSEQEIDTLFMEPDETTASEEALEVKKDSTPSKETQEEEQEQENETTEVIDSDSLFEEDEKPESVGSEKEVKEPEDAALGKGDGASPKNFYSSLANALAEDSIFPNQDEETVKKVDSAEALSDLIEAEVNARLDEKTQRVAKALENGVEPDEIRKYEQTLHYISSITDAAIAEESEKGEQLRYQLISQDFLNKGYTRERADKLTRRSIEAGTDLDDAKDALQSNREFFQNAYDNLLQEAQRQADADKKERQQQAEKLKKSLLEDKQVFGDLEVSNDIRKKAFESISKAVYKHPETGEYLTALQKYEMEHRSDFFKYVGLFFTLTNGFKDFDSFTKGKVKKEVKKGLRSLEQALNTTTRDTDGSFKMVTNAKNDPESFIGKGFKLDL